jgi:hypothetical protein
MLLYGIDTKKAMVRWRPLVETLGLNTKHPLGAAKFEWMSEMAEMHSIKADYNKVNENVAYVNMNTIHGMGPVVSPQPGAIPGMTGTTGSGDLGQNLLPIAMKIAYQTIGLDLVAVKPSSGPKIDLLFMDYTYDNSSLDGREKEKPQLFQIPAYAALKEHLQRLITENTNPSGRMFVGVQVHGVAPAAVHSPAQEGGIGGVKSTTSQAEAEAAVALGGINGITPGTVFYLEFIGFSIYNGNAIFRGYRQTNTASTGVWQFDPTRNSFPAKMSIATALGAYSNGAAWGVGSNVAWLMPSYAAGVGSTAKALLEGAGAGAAWAAGSYSNSVELVSVLEDHVQGFSANWNKNYGMTRAEDDDFNPGNIGPNFITKTVQTGIAEVSASVKRNQIEDIKATTGIDIVAKLEGILVNELSQRISREITAKVKQLADRNRTFAPRIGASLNAGWGGFETLFDFDVDRYVGGININGYNTNTGPGTGALTATNYRENSESLKRKLISKIRNASTFILKEGRYGNANYIVTNGNMAAAISDNTGYMSSPYTSAIDSTKQLYPAGTALGMTVYVDPYQDYMDNTLYLGRKNPIDQPGIVFIPYLMAQSLSIISEATRAPRLFLRSRYAVTEIGYYPEKQFLTIKVKDSQNILM